MVILYMKGGCVGGWGSECVSGRQVAGRRCSLDALAMWFTPVSGAINFLFSLHTL